MAQGEIMVPEPQRMERLRRLRELLARRAAIRREIRLLDTKIAVLSQISLQRRGA
jgi:hypothetical protein